MEKINNTKMIKVRFTGIIGNILRIQRRLLIYVATYVNILIIGTILLCSSVYAQGNLKDIPNPDPKNELEQMHVAKGFKVSLFASDPMVVKPIQMNWDAKGRLWVVSSTIYPHLKPGVEPHDKIYVLEDTTGDGKADKSTIFANGLLTPTGILPGDGGVYVANSTEILHLKDTDGDGKADQRRRVLNGFGTGDVHHLIHTFRWGPAGKLYFNQSIYIYSHVETPWGPRNLDGGGVWQYDPDSGKLNVMSRGLINPWGHRFGRWGESFLTDGAGRQGINYSFPGAIFTSAPNAKRILAGLNPGQPKESGLGFVSGRHLPKSWQGDLITNDFRANRINRFVLKEKGSGYISKQAEDLLWSDDVAFRPVDISVGPDGAIYVLDWYNPIIQHGEVDFRDPRRDHQHGRIWKITAKDQPLVKPPQLVGATTKKLLDALKLPEKWSREQAKRLLKEQGANAVIPPLKKWVRNLDENDADYEHQLLEALWVCQSVDVINEPLLKKLLHADSHNARAAAVSVLSYWYDEIDNAPNLLEKAAGDEAPRVRLEAVIALRRDHSAHAADVALSVLDKPMDNFLDFALWQTIRKLESYWMPQIKSNPDYFGDSRRTVYALKSVDDPQVIGNLIKLYEAGEVPDAYESDVLNSIAQWGDSNDLNQIFEWAMSDDENITVYLKTLEQAAQQRNKKPSSNLDRIGDYIHATDEATAISAVRLIGYWKLKKFRRELVAMVRKSNKKMQKAALGTLTAMGDRESINALIALTRKDHPAELRLMATEELVSSDISEAATSAVKILKDLQKKPDATELYTAFISHKNGPGILADALSKETVPAKMANVGMQVIQSNLSSHRQKDDDVQSLEKALKASGGELPPERMPQDLSSQQKNRLELDIKSGADLEHGEDVFRKLACMSCHAVGGAGGHIGPELSSIGANAPTDYIINSVLKPGADIKDGYELNRIVKKDGSVIMGYPVNETTSVLVLRNTAGEEVSIPKSQIDVHKVVPGSLMPQGLTASLKREEFVDLIGFLSKLGEPGAFRVPNAQLIRKWEMVADSKENAKLIRKNGLDSISKESSQMQWQETYSKVSGDLPINEIPVLELDSNQRYSFVKFKFKVLSGGNIVLSFNSTNGITAREGEKTFKLQDQRALIKLSEGVHPISVVIDRNLFEKKALRIQLQEAKNKAAQTRINIR